MRAIFLIFFKREIISYKVKRSFEGSGLNNAQFQCGISQILFEETNLWPDYEEFDGKISIFGGLGRRESGLFPLEQTPDRIFQKI